MDRIPMTDDEIAHCEQYAADEDAERMYQEMSDEEMYGAEIMAVLDDAERAYQRLLEDDNDTPVVKTDLF